MGNDICTPLNRSAINRSGEGVIHNKRNTMRMRRTSKTFQIQNRQSGVCNSFTKYRFSVGLKSSLELLFRTGRAYKSAFQTHTLHCVSKQVVRSSIDCRRCHNVVSIARNIKDGKKVSRLTRRGEHSCCSAFKFSNFCRHIIIRRILQTSIKIARLF